MKRFRLIVRAWVLLFCPLVACLGANSQTLRPKVELQEVGPNYKLWTRPARAATNPEESIEHRNIVEIETGMNYWNGFEWVASDATFDVTDDAFIATRMQHKVRLDGQLNVPGAVTVTTRDNVVLKSTPVAIGLYDAQSGKAIIISAVTNAFGAQVSSNKVLFENAFSGVSADVLYTINKGSFEQDVIITGRLNPADYGFPAKTTRVQIYTEFYDAPAPERVRRPLRVEADRSKRQAMAKPDLVDDVLGFGEFVLPTGRAALGNINPDKPAAPVVKEFTALQNRTFLIESVEYTSLYPEKKQAAVRSRPVNSRGRVVAKLAIPGPAKKRSTAQMPSSRVRTVAALTKKEGSVIIDYIGTIGPGFSTPTVFQGDTTYLVTGTVTCNSATTMEGGVVFKFKSGANIQLNNSLTTATSSHRPIIFTAVDDDSVGETMNGVTNSAYAGTISSGGYANPALQFNGVNSQTLQNMRFRYCQEAIRLSSSTDHSVSHIQLVNCIKGITITGCGCGFGTAVTVKNGLFSSVTYPLTLSWDRSVDFQNCTIDNTPRVITDTASGSCNFVNCLLASVTTLYTGTPSVSGNNNGFYSCSTFGTSTTTVSSNPFRSVKAGNYYLAPGSTLRNAGTTIIDSTLAADLKQRTVNAPVVLSGTVSGTLYPVAGNDADTPDLGYHYDRVDYIGRELSVTSDGNPLYLTNGVVVAFYGNYGIQIPENGAVIGQGTPLSMNRFVWYPSVQDQPTLLDSISTRASALFDVSGATSSSATKPVLQFRYTDFPMLGLRQDFFKTGAARPLNLKTLALKDSWLRGVNLAVSSTTTSFGTNTVPSATFTNNLLERATLSLFNGYVTSGSTYQNPIAVSSYNNLLWKSDLVLSYYDASATSHPAWVFQDNVFHNGTVSLAGDGSYQTYVTRSYDGYFSTTGSSQLSGTGDVTLTALTYSPPAAIGWPWYQNTRTPTLHDVDSTRTGAAGGLYHFTTKTSEGKETTSNMDFGFHYVVLGTGNVPNDADGDGIADYLEDTNGNGTADTGAGETDWQTSENGTTGTPGLLVFTTLE